MADALLSSAAGAATREYIRRDVVAPTIATVNALNCEIPLSDWGIVPTTTAADAQKLQGSRFPDQAALIAEFPELVTAGYTGAQAFTATDTLASAIIAGLTERHTRKNGLHIMLPGGTVWASRAWLKPEAGKEFAEPGAFKPVGMLGVDAEISALRAVGQITGTPGEEHGFVISCRNRHATTKGSVGSLRGFTIICNEQTDGRMGAAPCITSALGWGSRCDVDEMGFRHPYRAVDMTGDHTNLGRLRMVGAGVLIYFSMGNPTLFGDFDIDRLVGDGTRIANFVAHKDASIPKMTFRNGFSGTSIRVFYKEMGGAKNFMFESVKVEDGFVGESYGIDVQHSGHPITSDPVAPFGRNNDGTPRSQRAGMSEGDLPNVNYLTVRRAQHGPQNDAFKPHASLAALYDSTGYAWNLRQVFRGMEFDGFMEPGLTDHSFTGSPPAKGWMQLLVQNGSRFRGAVGEIADHCFARGAEFIGPRGPAHYAPVIVEDTQDNWRGQWVCRRDGFEVKRYQPLMQGNGATVTSDGTKPRKGVCRTPPIPGLYKGYLAQMTGSIPVRVADDVVGDDVLMDGTGANAGKCVKWDNTWGKERGTGYEPGTRTVDGEANVKISNLEMSDY